MNKNTTNGVAGKKLTTQEGLKGGHLQIIFLDLIKDQIKRRLPNLTYNKLKINQISKHI